MNKTFEIRECQNPLCGLRYPIQSGHPVGERCPLCLGGTQVVLSWDTLSEPEHTPINQAVRIHLMADNIRSAWNIGAIFRTADCFGVEHVHLCGISATPDSDSVRKTALGADQIVSWSYARNALIHAKKLLTQGFQLWALEQDTRSLPLFDVVPELTTPIVLILGNEVSGVDPALLDLCTKIVQIPMLGKKRSLNVEVACGAALAILRSPHG